MTWPTTTIGSACLPTKQVSPTQLGRDTFRYIDISGVDRHSKAVASVASVACDKAPSRARKLVRSGDVLVSTVRPNLNAVALVPNELDEEIASTGFAVLRADQNVLDPSYLFYRTQRPDFVDYLAANATGASYPAVTDTIVKRAPLPLPSLGEQRRIVGILDQAGAWRKRQREADAKAARILPALFLKMFGDPATNPMGWPKLPLCKLLQDANVFTDGDWVESKDQDPNGDVRLIQLADVGDGVYIDKSSRYLTRETAIRLRCTFLKPGDVLIARMPDPLGRACIFPGDEKEAVTVVDVCIVRPAIDGPDPFWLVSCINTTGFRALIDQQRTGTTRGRISRGNLSRIPIIYPPAGTQIEFRKLSTIVRSVLDRSFSDDTINRVFQVLLQCAFSGELTAKWPDSRMPGLLQEMERQIRMLDPMRV
jgi:type I restriction enzyme S subunit